MPFNWQLFFLAATTPGGLLLNINCAAWTLRVGGLSDPACAAYLAMRRLSVQSWWAALAGVSPSPFAACPPHAEEALSMACFLAGGIALPACISWLVETHYRAAFAQRCLPTLLEGPSALQWRPAQRVRAAALALTLCLVLIASAVDPAAEFVVRSGWQREL